MTEQEAKKLSCAIRDIRDYSDGFYGKRQLAKYLSCDLTMCVCTYFEFAIIVIFFIIIGIMIGVEL